MPGAWLEASGALVKAVGLSQRSAGGGFSSGDGLVAGMRLSWGLAAPEGSLLP